MTSSSKYANLTIEELHDLLDQSNSKLDFENSKIIHQMILKKEHAIDNAVITDQIEYISKTYSQLFADMKESLKDLDVDYSLKENVVRRNVDILFTKLTDAHMKQLINITLDKNLSIAQDEANQQSKAENLSAKAMEYAKKNEYEKAIRLRELSRKEQNTSHKKVFEDNYISKKTKLLEYFSKEIHQLEKNLNDELDFLATQKKKEILQMNKQLENYLRFHLQKAIDEIIEQKSSKESQKTAISKLSNHAIAKASENGIQLVL